MSPPQVKPYVEGQTGSLSDVIERGPELAPFTPAGPDGFAPDPTWSQMFQAAKPAARRSTLLSDGTEIVPNETKLLNAYTPIVDALGLPPSENPARFYDADPSTLAVTGALGQPSALATAAQQGESAPFGGQRLATRQLQENLIVTQIRARRAKDPNFLPGIPDTIDGIHAYAEEQEAKARAAGAAVLARGSGFGRFTAGLAAGGAQSALHDPSFLPSMVLGGGTATSAMQAVGRDALINGVFAAVYAPADVYRSVVEDHEPLTTALGEATTNIVSAAAIGAAAGATIHLATAHVPPALFKVMPESVQARWASRMRVGENGPLLKDVLGDMDNRELSTFARSTIGTRMTPDEKAAASVLERSQELGEASPFEPGPQGDAAHNANLATSLKSIIDGAPHGRGDLLASSSPIGLRPPSPVAVPLDAGFEAQWHAIVGNEGGTGPHGEFLTSPKGAIGPAQVMPGTAPYAAKLAGLPWDEARYRGDPAYNQALGRAYYAEQLKTFGDPDMAAAAYNAGPGSAARGTGLRGALKRAAEHGEPGNWEAYLPRETQAYVENFRKRAGGAAAGDRAVVDVAGGEDPALAELNRSADQAEADALELSRDRATAEPVPLLKRDLFPDDQSWAEAQASFHQSLNAPEEPAVAPLSSETPSGPAEVAPEAAAGAPGASDEAPAPGESASGAPIIPFDGHVRISVAGHGDVVIPAVRIGDLAVHRSIVDGEATGKSWTITHGPTGYSVALGVPDRAAAEIFKTKRATVEFAQKWMEGARSAWDQIREPLGPESRHGTEAFARHYDVLRRVAHAIADGREPELDLVAAQAALGSAADVRIDEPALQAFDEPSGAGPKDQLGSLEHDARMAAAEPERAARTYDIDGKKITLAELLDEFDRDRASAAALRTCAGAAA